MTTVSIIGSGAWGMALAINADHSRKNVMVYAHDATEYDMLKNQRKIATLPTVEVPVSLHITNDLAEAAQANIILMAVPAQTMRTAITTLVPHLNPEAYIILCSKGIELETGLLMSQVAEQLLPQHSLSVLSGPTFALEVAQRLPASAVLANPDMATSRWLASSLSNENMRIYTSTDMIGLQVTGALKNVIAIAAGIVMGYNLGENARAALISRGLQEMMRLGIALGAHADTFHGLAGVGDLLLTATSMQSRNYALGVAIGRNDDKRSTLLTEGAHTVQVITQLAKQFNIEMPICRAVRNILNRDSTIDDEIARLWSRPLKNE